jgi:PAS domain-containing protein
VTPPTDIAHWRRQIFSRLLTIVLVLGLVTAVPCIANAVRERMWPMIGVVLLSTAWLVGVWYLTALSYTARVLNFIAIVFFISIGLMVNVGHVAQIFLIAPPVFASVLLGMRPALVALAISALALLVLGLTGLTGLARLDVAGYAESDVVPSVLTTLNFLFVGSMITVSCGTLLTRLAQSLDELHLFAASLEEGTDALHAMNAELRLTGAALAQLNDKVLITRAVDATDGQYQPQPIIFANDAFLLRTGYTREELLGQSLTAFIGPASDGAQMTRVIGAMARGEGTSAELQVYTKSGEPYWIEPGAHVRHGRWLGSPPLSALRALSLRR